MEAPARFELANRGFADLCLTTWLWRHMERKTGFEPATLALARRCSTPEPLPQNLETLLKNPTKRNPIPAHETLTCDFCVEHFRGYRGGSGRNRTADTRIFSPLLYRLSYRAKMGNSHYCTLLSAPMSTTETALFPMASRFVIQKPFAMRQGRTHTKAGLLRKIEFRSASSVYCGGG